MRARSRSAQFNIINSWKIGGEVSDILSRKLNKKAIFVQLLNSIAQDGIVSLIQ